MENTQCLCAQKWVEAALKITKRLSTGKYLNEWWHIHSREHGAAVTRMEEINKYWYGWITEMYPWMVKQIAERYLEWMVCLSLSLSLSLTHTHSHTMINLLNALKSTVYYGIWCICIYTCIRSGMDFPGGSDGKVSAYNAGDLDSIPGSGRSPGEGNGNPLQYSCLEKPMDRGAW